MNKAHFEKVGTGNIQLLLYKFFVQMRQESNLDNESKIAKKAWSEYNEYLIRNRGCLFLDFTKRMWKKREDLPICFIIKQQT